MPCPVQLAFHKFSPNDPEAWTLFSPIVPIKQLWAHCTRVFVYMCPRRKESSFTHFYILGALAQGFINDWMKRQGEEEGEIVWIQKANEHTGTPSPGKVMLVFGNLGKRRPREEICRKILKRRAVSESGQCAGQHSMWGCTCVCVHVSGGWVSWRREGFSKRKLQGTRNLFPHNSWKFRNGNCQGERYRSARKGAVGGWQQAYGEGSKAGESSVGRWEARKSTRLTAGFLPPFLIGSFAPSYKQRLEMPSCALC